MKIEKVKKILEIIKEKKMVSVTSLQQELNIPRTSLLRYLSELEANGDIVKTFGEVKIRESREESHATGRVQTHKIEKRKIADHALKLIKDGEVIFLDGGTTTYKIAKALKDKEVVIYTNNLLIVDLINVEYQPEVIFVPGRINKKTLCAASIESIKYVDSITFSKAFVGFNAFANGSYSTTNSEEAFLKEAIVTSTKSGNAYVIGGSYKINSEPAQYAFCKNKKMNLITEKGVK